MDIGRMAEKTEELMLSERQRACLTRLVLDHQGHVRALLGRFERDASAVDELAQDVFLSVVSKCEELAEWPEREAEKYLRAVARNLVRMRWRKAQRSKVKDRAEIPALLQGERDLMLDREPDDSEARLSALRGCVEGLPPHAREMVEDHFFKGKPLAGIARVLGQSDAAIRMTFLRIRRQLRLCVETRLRVSP